MNTIGLLVRDEILNDHESVRHVLKCFDELGYDVRFYDETKGGESAGKLFFDGIEAFFVLGGDGTLIKGAVLAAPFSVPVMGINLGHLGFLSETGIDGVRDCLEKYASGKYEILERTMLSASFSEDEQDVLLALNDIGLTRKQFARIIHVEVYINGEVVGNYPCDGLLVASATGSTGYALSAGGPIISPALDTLLVAPICAHMLNSRPIVISGGDVVHLRAAEDGDAVLIADGKLKHEFEDRHEVFVRRAALRSRFIRTGDVGFFGLLQRKLSKFYNS